MKVYIIIAVKLLIIMSAVYYFNLAQDQMTKHDQTTICLNSQNTHKLCAQCFRRDEEVIKNKGYHVVSNGATSVLKIQSNSSILSCNEYLQMLDIQKDHVLAEQFHIDRVEPILQILLKLNAKFSTRKSEYPQSQYIIQPQYNQFIVFKWKQYSKQIATLVTSINTQYYNDVKVLLMYIFNIAVGIVLIAWVSDSQFIKILSKPIKISLVLILICFQLWLLGIAKWWCHYLLRLFILNLGLFKLKVNNLRVLSYIGIGLFMTYFPFTICIYTGAITILVAYYGKDQSQTKSIKLYLVVFYTLLLLNYSYWYQFTIYLNDIPSVVIQFFTLLFIPTGVFLLPDDRQAIHIPRDQEENRRISRVGISLSGHDDDDQYQ